MVGVVSAPSLWDQTFGTLSQFLSNSLVKKTRLDNQSLLSTVLSRANGNSSKWEFDRKKFTKLFASKWEFKQMGIFLRKTSRRIENGNISYQMRQFSALKRSKHLKMGIQNLATLFLSKWEYFQKKRTKRLKMGSHLLANVL